jgi:hypothetical protein
VIRFRSLWASDERGLRRALEAVTAGVAPAREQSTRMLTPMLAALGYLDGILRTAGPRAAHDLARSAPPMLLGARLASVFGRLRPERRGLAVVAVTVSLVIVVGCLIIA